MSASKILACTIITDSHRAHAEVLERSFREHHPDAEFVVLNLDSGDPLPLDKDELLRMAAIYNAKQLIGALKPLLIRDGLERGAEGVILLDNDIEVFAALDGAIQLALEHGLVLTPHMTTASAKLEPWFLRSGMVNGGFVAAGSQALPALDWWAARTSRFAHFAPDQGYFYEQRWLDLTLSLFGAHLLRDPGYNVMGWNLHERTVTFDGRPLVNGRPLVFFHFCGSFDPHRAELLGTLPGLPWPSLASQPAVAQLCRSYAEKLILAGYEQVRALPYRYGTTSAGEPVDARMRLAYREALLDAEGGDGDEPPNPFADGETFMEWLSEPLDGLGLNRYLLTVRAERIDLRLAFPDVPGADSARFLDWVRDEPRNRESIPARFMPGV